MKCRSKAATCACFAVEQITHYSRKMKPGLINGPAQANFDVSLAKQIPMNVFGRESAWLFRAEFFNLFNNPSFGDPDINTADGASFGTISSAWAIRESCNLP